jgi:hypothetical protein
VGVPEQPAQRRERERVRRRRQRRRVWQAAKVIPVVAVFFVGLALGQALDDNPTPGRATYVRTLKPLPVPPAASTVTVTTGRR